jgi:peptidoglycan/LPS O-acetylase OafA/YrhL
MMRAMHQQRLALHPAALLLLTVVTLCAGEEAVEGVPPLPVLYADSSPAVARWLAQSQRRPSSPFEVVPGLVPVPGQDACLAQLPEVCPALAGHALECDECIAKPKNQQKIAALQTLHGFTCTKADESFYCNHPWGRASEVCQAGLNASFAVPEARPQSAGIDMAQFNGMSALASWSTELGNMGYFYQCNAAEGFQYWFVYLGSDPPPPCSTYAAEKPCDAQKGRCEWADSTCKHLGWPPFSEGVGGTGGQQRKVTLGICLPDACSNDADAKKIADDYLHFGLLTAESLAGEKLEAIFVAKAGAPPLDGPAKTMLWIICICVVLCVVSTLYNSSGLAECQAAMPMAESLDAVARKRPSPSGSGSAVSRRAAMLICYPERAQELSEMSELEQWRLIQLSEQQVARETPSGGNPPRDFPSGGNRPRSWPSSTSIEGPPLVTEVVGMSGSPEARAGHMVSKPLLPPPATLGGAPNQTARGWAANHAFLGPLIRTISCWDCGQNWRAGLMKQDGGVAEMRVLNGLRVLSMGWVVLCHGFLYAQGEVDNQYYSYVVRNRFLSTLLPNGDFSVDTFFVLSGFLGSYVGLRKLAAVEKSRNKGKPLGWRASPMIALNFAVERYLRLTPAYLFVLMIYMYLLPHLITGPTAGLNQAHPNENGIGKDFEFCQRYVWTNLLYISNLYPNQFTGSAAGGNTASLGCMGHSWYLSNDFQLHLLTPWLLLLFRAKPKAAFGLMWAIVLASLGYMFYLTSEYHWSTGCHDRGFKGNSIVLVYGKPWCRCGAFVLGVMLACYQNANATKHGHLQPPGLPTISLGYLAAWVIMFGCVFSPYWATQRPDWFASSCGWSHAYDTVHSVGSRTAWGASICWLIYACLTCQGGPVTRFLSWSFWTPFARLTYCWYLLHPLLMQLIYDSAPKGITYYDLLFVAFYCFNCVIGLLLAATTFFLVETPMANLKALIQPPLYHAMGRAANAMVRTPGGGGGEGGGNMQQPLLSVQG